MARSNLESLQALMTWGIHPESATIFLDVPPGNMEPHDDSITALSTSNFLRGLHYLRETKNISTPINIIINSTGGDVDHGFAIYDAIINIPHHVIITVAGSCHSMAAAILQAGDVRRIYKHSSLMIHDGEQVTIGHNRKSRKNWTEFGKLQDAWYEKVLYDALLEKNEAFSKTQLTNWLAADTIFTSEQCIELGLVDEII